MGSFHRSLTFLKRFLSNPASVGAFWPSSRRLSRAMAKDLMIEPGSLIVEFGPGAGPFTEMLEPHVLNGAGARYLGIERDPVLHRILTQRFPRLQFHLGDAGHLPRILGERRLPPPRTILSGLPFRRMSEAETRALLEQVRAMLPPGGTFRTYAYLHTWPLPGWRRLRRLLGEVFRQVEKPRIVLRNLPPAVVLTAHA
jgi:phospholipid N-methyltransferase